jgi:nicotinate phosphoribosyltransferase
MIESFIDNDLYKLTMQYAIELLYPNAWAKYKLFMRRPVVFPDGFDAKLRSIIEKFAGTQILLEEQRKFIREKCYYLPDSYLDILDSYRYDPRLVHIEQKDGNLSVTVAGPWRKAIMWEVPLMAAISELYFELAARIINSEYLRGKENIAKAVELGSRAQFIDFGTRRRFSSENHRQVIETMKDHAGPNFKGTSNLHFGMEFNLPVHGTHAHEWFQYHGAVFGVEYANHLALDAWTKVYNGSLGVALTDTYTTPVFLKQFDIRLAKLFDGVRQDSGDPIEFMEKMIAHYEKLHIDPKSKTIVFSDQINLNKMVAIESHRKDRIKSLYGIGTNLTNDVGTTPLNMVIKLVRVSANGDPNDYVRTVKLSDDTGKETGDVGKVDLVKRTLGLI